jgi:hypothetical protein
MLIAEYERCGPCAIARDPKQVDQVERAPRARKAPVDSYSSFITCSGINERVEFHGWYIRSYFTPLHFLNNPLRPFFSAFCASSVARLVMARFARLAVSIRTCGAAAGPVMVAGKVTRPPSCV